MSTYETETANLIFILERGQLVTTVTGIVNLHYHIRWELLRTLRTKEKEEERKEIKHLKTPEKQGQKNGGHEY